MVLKIPKERTMEGCYSRGRGLTSPAGEIYDDSGEVEEEEEALRLGIDSMICSTFLRS
jgi:hypothetical protein